MHWETARDQHWGCLWALSKGSQTDLQKEMEWVHWWVIQMDSHWDWNWGWSWEWQKGFHLAGHWDYLREDPMGTRRETRTDWVLAH